MDRWERIAPDRAPGGLVFRLTAGGRVWAEHLVPLSDGLATVDEIGTGDGEMAVDLAARFGESRLFVYDGDTGECVTTFITGGPDG